MVLTIHNLALRKIELIRIQAFAGSPFKTTNGTVTVISLPSKVSKTQKKNKSKFYFHFQRREEFCLKLYI